MESPRTFPWLFNRCKYQCNFFEQKNLPNGMTLWIAIIKSLICPYVMDLFSKGKDIKDLKSHQSKAISLLHFAVWFSFNLKDEIIFDCKKLSNREESSQWPNLILRQLPAHVCVPRVQGPHRPRKTETVLGRPLFRQTSQGVPLRPRSGQWGTQQWLAGRSQL